MIGDPVSCLVPPVSRRWLWLKLCAFLGMSGAAVPFALDHGVSLAVKLLMGGLGGAACFVVVRSALRELSDRGPAAPERRASRDADPGSRLDDSIAELGAINGRYVSVAVALAFVTAVVVFALPTSLLFAGSAAVISVLGVVTSILLDKRALNRHLRGQEGPKVVRVSPTSDALTALPALRTPPS